MTHLGVIPNSANSETEQNNTHLTSGLDVAIPMNPLDLMELGQNFQILPVPTDDDDLEATVRKMNQLAKVVQRGHSLALWTGLKLVPEARRDVEGEAIELMTPHERMQYDEWKKMNKATLPSNKDDEPIPEDVSDVDQSACRMRLPNFDWEKNVMPIPQGQHSLKKFSKRAAAMDIVFGHQGATPEHASWLTFNMTPLLPLIKAVTKINNIGTHFETLGDPHMYGLTGMEIAELKTARRIMAAAEKNRNREFENFHKMARIITERASVIKSRAQAVERKDRQQISGNPL